MTINRSTVASLAIIAMFFTFAMCVKTDNPTTEDAALLKSFFDKNAPKTETFTFNANQSFTITTSKGSTIVFPANSLLDGTGKVATGTVEVSVKEVRTAADMLLSDKPTVVKDGGAMLISFGEIKVDARQNGNILRIRDTVGLNVNMAFVPNAAQIREMPLWSGDTTVSVTTPVSSIRVPVGAETCRRRLLPSTGGKKSRPIPGTARAARIVAVANTARTTIG